MKIYRGASILFFDGGKSFLIFVREVGRSKVSVLQRWPLSYRVTATPCINHRKVLANCIYVWLNL